MEDLVVIKVEKHYEGVVVESRLGAATPLGMPDDGDCQEMAFAEVCYAVSALLTTLIIDSTPMPSGGFLRIKKLHGYHDLAIDVGLGGDDPPEEPMKKVTAIAADTVVEIMVALWDERGWQRPRFKDDPFAY